MGEPRKTIRIGTINVDNIWHHWYQRRHLLVEQLLSADLDLISLQEVNPLLRQGRWLKRQLNRTGVDPYQWMGVTHLFPWSGVGVMSRLPVLAEDSFYLGQGRRVIRLYVTLPMGQAIDFVSVHLHPRYQGLDIRKESVMRLQGWLNSRGPGRIQIIAGDFCDLPENPAIRLMKQQYRSAFEQRHGSEPLATYPTLIRANGDDWSGCLDYIFLSNEAKVKESKLFCNKRGVDKELYPSDHVGVMAEIEF